MNPRESLIHVTSHGKTAAQKSGTLNFQNYTKAPIKDVNRIGLVHYSIPKTLDHLDHTNNTFRIRVTFAAESGVTGDAAPAHIGNSVDIKVTIPLLDYYNCKVATVIDQAEDVFDDLQISQYGVTFCKAIHAFEEILQTTINQAIIKSFDDAMTAYYGSDDDDDDDDEKDDNSPNGYQSAPTRYQALSRLNCIVMYDFKRGVYELFFGYRGGWNIEHHDGLDSDGDSALPKYGDTYQSYTGAPADLVDNGDSHPVVNALAHPGGEAYFITPSGKVFNPHRVFNNIPASLTNPNRKPDMNVVQQIVISDIYLHGLSPRLQLMLGCNESTSTNSVATDKPYLRRGWVGLINYKTFENQTLPIHKITLDNPPNLKPPAFLIMQLTTQGTRSRMLGHENERGGWAIPTAPNQFVSTHHNHVSGHLYPLYTPRGTHFNPVRATVKYHDESIKANWDSGICWPEPDTPGTGHGYHFDALPRNGYGTAANGGTASNLGMMGTGNSYGLNNIYNFSRTSEHIQFKNLDISKPGDCCIPPQSYQFLSRKSPVFTVSLIQPNWLYTQMDNATLQSLDIKLLWGDTGTPVDAVCGNPTQASFIVAP